jgi:hypothetical protein
MTRVAVWERLDTKGLEYAEFENDPLRLAGQVILVEDGVPLAISYRVECDGEGRTARAAVTMRRQGAVAGRLLVRSAEGRWTLEGTPAPALDGLDDVDLSITPSTNTLPLRRLRLGVGEEAAVTAAWVRFPLLDVVPLRQTYRRVSAMAFAYAAPDHDFAADLECDGEGVVTSYGALWRRVR